MRTSRTSTLVPVTEGVLNKPEWLRVPAAVKGFGIGKTKLYELIGQGKIKSVSLRERGGLRGIRLVSYDSLCAYMDSLAIEQEQERASTQAI